MVRSSLFCYSLPTEVQVHVQKTEDWWHFKLACNTSCPQTEAQNITWYKNRRLEPAPQSVLITSLWLLLLCCRALVLRWSLWVWARLWSVIIHKRFESRACKREKDKLFDDLFKISVSGIQDKYCFRVNYVNRRICALQGSSVNISSEYSHPYYQQWKSKSWYKNRRSDMSAGEELIKNTDRIKSHGVMNSHILTINKLNKNDSAEYIFRIGSDAGRWSAVPGVTLVVTGRFSI